MAYFSAGVKPPVVWHPIQGESDHTHYIKETAMSPGTVKHTKPDEDSPPPSPTLKTITCMFGQSVT